MIQNFNLMNEAVIPIHPLVADPYTILSHISGANTWLSAIDLFNRLIVLHPPYIQTFSFCLPLNEKNPFLEPKQCTLIVVLQGFRDNPLIFAWVLGKDLRKLKLEQENIKQYADEIRVCPPTPELTITLYRLSAVWL